jgi:PTH1 family peptidyl-tRNA hydrolase
MKAVLGLGNPGARYAATRHNIGWMVLDAVADALHGEYVPAKGEYYEARLRYRGREVLLVKPTTYMNNSGIAARQLVERHGIAPQEILAIVDEIQFPVGRVQLRASGSSGGHNGTESLIYQLETADFPRLRCGVGNDFGPGEMVEYVLGEFPVEQAELLQRMIDTGRDAVLTWIVEGTARAMTLVNREKKEAKETPESGGEETKKSEDAAEG